MFIGCPKIGLPMTRKSRSAQERKSWPAQYELRVAGRIGPFIRSALPELTDVPVPESSVLTGTVGHLDDLRRLLDALEAHGLTSVSHRVRRREQRAPGIDYPGDEPGPRAAL